LQQCEGRRKSPGIIKIIIKRRHDMQRNMKLILIMMPLVLLAVCIFSSSPPEGNIPLTWGSTQTFNVKGLGTYQWYVNDAPVSGATQAIFTFNSIDYGLGTYDIKVKSIFVVNAERTWKVIVKQPPSVVPAANNCDDIVNAGLVCSKVQNCSDIYPKGTVISQSPKAGIYAPAGATVTLTISSGICSNEVEVPAAIGCSDITAAGLVCETQQSCSPSIPAGIVIRQSPPAGTMVQPGTTVSLLISTGPCTIEKPVPIVTSCDDVEEAGFVCSRTRLCSNTVPAGYVITQSPEAGAMVLPGSTIQLAISTGLCGATVPDATTCEEITAAGLICNRVFYCSDEVPQGGVIGISPPPGTGLTYGSTVNLILSNGRCTVPVPDAASCDDVTAAGFVCSTSSTCSNSIPAGGVISQSPAPGTMVTPGSTVQLIISSGVCAQELPAPQNVKASDVILTSVTNPLLNHNLNDRVRITWNAVANAGKYEIYRADSPIGTYNLIGTVDAPTTTYDDMQTETLTLPDLPTDLTAANIDAYELIARPIMNDFKNFKYYKVKACSTSPSYTNSILSSYDEGRIDYTLEEFYMVAKLAAGAPLARVMIQDPDPNIGTDETYYDTCGDGNVHFTVALSGLSGLIKVIFTNYVDSLIYITALHSVDCTGNRRIIINGTVSGTVNTSFNGTFTGNLAFTGNYAGTFTNINLPVVNKTIGAGTVTVRYNGQEAAGHAFGL